MIAEMALYLEGSDVWSMASAQVMTNWLILCTCAIGLLLFILSHKKSRPPRNTQHLLAFAEWARHQIESCPPEEANKHRVLEDVICAFARYAQRVEKAGKFACEEGVERKKKLNTASIRAADMRLRVLGDLLQAPGVCQALREANWAWVRAFDQNELTPEEIKLRCTVIFPTILAAAAHSRACPAKRGSNSGLDAKWARPDLDLMYIAGWCADFLERADVIAFLQRIERLNSDVDDWEVAGSDSNGVRSESDDEEALQAAIGEARVSAGATVNDVAEKDDPKSKWLPRQIAETQVHSWTEPDATRIKVRGKRYMTDRVKVKSSESLLELVIVDVFVGDEVLHYCGNGNGAVPDLRAAGESRFLFALNFRLPPVHFVGVWAVPDDPAWEESAAGRLFRRFCSMTNHERNTRFKILPRIAEGPWLVKAAVSEKPGVLGHKLAIDYLEGDSSLEVSVNCLSSPAARHIASVLCPAARAFVVQIFMILEGKTEDELPEKILGGMQVSYCDLPGLRQHYRRN
eukprot:TRINITY_DN26003_c0_g1_i1.p1 TRINITY_DN26003_c0_g1~~TRINITY_DN26003_c0_g1_i1.p1  ORF type:complete len:517 (-),score=82.70 TRINITY_DN26003_c0_g1_i1:297-1847(-)